MARQEIFFKEFLCSGIYLTRKSKHFEKLRQDIKLIF